MTATQNSIEAYMDLKDTGELGKSQKQVLDFITHYPQCSYNDIARVLHMHHNTVTARIKELRDEGYIICCGSKIDEFTHKSNNIYRLRRVGENPDITVNDAIPTLPPRVTDFLKKAVRRQVTADEITLYEKGIRYRVEVSPASGISFEYGDFIKLHNIGVACEDNAHRTISLSSPSCTIKFRIN